MRQRGRRAKRRETPHGQRKVDAIAEWIMEQYERRGYFTWAEYRDRWYQGRAEKLAQNVFYEAVRILKERQWRVGVVYIPRPPAVSTSRGQFTMAKRLKVNMIAEWIMEQHERRGYFSWSEYRERWFHGRTEKAARNMFYEAINIIMEYGWRVDKVYRPYPI